MVIFGILCPIIRIAPITARLPKFARAQFATTSIIADKETVAELLVA
ncbi:hypothetical protein Z949_875 [Sulfitobacter guttiformis KCTC 32187]|nr:hypothetical protein Z949_875 [Sulfitobacter guttiformis KCTC 32187]